ncbi:unnamed protein product [Rotaria sp. Silwood1]|nr:unnamed protein product [Rotaria sp. Silwood1]CAF3641157.1 unnamed protein product [Rotaria sp. Silwood1]
MGNSLWIWILNYKVQVQTSDGYTFPLCCHDLVDHIILLRQGIAHPEMTAQGQLLNYFVNEYCKLMTANKMISKWQQVELLWEIEWIWHVYCLHAISYSHDCIT